MALLFAGTGWGQVNQNLGFRDSAFSGVTAADCSAAACHGASTVTRHHALYGDTAEGPVQSPPAVLADSDNSGTADPAYGCLNCHGTSFTVERDCTACHGATGSPHHTIAGGDAQAGTCTACHSYVTDYTATPTRPSYDPATAIAPVPGDKAGGPGGCKYCHDKDDTATPAILDNEDLHHDTGLHDGGSNTHCAKCHVDTIVDGGSDPGNTFTETKECEACHSMAKLHNTQASNAGVDIPSPGASDIGRLNAGMGHVGRDQPGAGTPQSDCWGCHGDGTALGVTSLYDAIIPTVYSANRSTVLAGTESMIVLTGAMLTNIADGTLFEAEGVLTAADGSSVSLKPAAIDQGMMVVTIPADTAPGTYMLRAVKYRPAAEGSDGPGEPVPSNPVAISVVPQVSISGVSLADGIVTIAGSGFAGHQAGSGTSVTGKTGAAFAEATIVSWSDTEIKADFGGASPDLITVHSIYGTATEEIAGN